MTPIILTHIYVNCIQNKASPFTIVIGGEEQIAGCSNMISDYLVHYWKMNKVLFLPFPIPYINQKTGSKLCALRRDLETSQPQQGETVESIWEVPEKTCKLSPISEGPS